MIEAIYHFRTADIVVICHQVLPRLSGCLLSSANTKAVCRRHTQVCANREATSPQLATVTMEAKQYEFR